MKMLCYSLTFKNHAVNDPHNSYLMLLCGVIALVGIAHPFSIATLCLRTLSPRRMCVGMRSTECYLSNSLKESDRLENRSI